MPHLTTLSIVSLLTILSSFLGFFREILIGKIFGVSAAADCFIVAFSAISFVFLIFNTSTIQTAFMPLYQQQLSKGNKNEATRVFNSFLKILVITLFIFSFLMLYLGDYYIPLIVPGFDRENIALTFQIIKILTPLVLLLGLSGLFLSVCNANQSFFNPLLSQLVNNVVIVFALFIGIVHSITSLAWAFFIGGLLSFLLLIKYTIPYLQGSTSFYKEKLFIEPLIGSIPIFFLVIFEQFGTLIQKTIASGLEAGSISALNYSYKLASFPITIFAVPVSMVFFPTLINYVENNSPKLSQYFHKGINLIFYCLLPATLFFLTNSENIVSICFGSQAFDSIAIEKTSSALLFYSFGLVAQGFLIYFHKVYFAYKQSILYLKITLVGGTLHIFSCWLCCKFFGHIGIAIGTSIYAIINAFLLSFYLSKFSNLAINLKKMLKPTLAILFTFFLTMTIANKNGFIFLMTNIGVTALLFYGSLWLMNDREFKDILADFKRG
jgi:putative peptidoglycan lipid II flippase